ncbi:hypothetical protein PHMEG_00040224 [Phytophthora megakarya]|uniref:Uncharacterized protein n=1 Tax=Phytophthora megakarya TaxID=4795 RepID=A0A225UDF6_9STRA|nr:hypothetical protein PHMEG_00040224 [Phytophthora megakarya]
MTEPNDDIFATHKKGIVIVLSRYGKELSVCVFSVGDNCAANTYQAKLIKVPLVGCTTIA